jgi:hypothetical protein
LVPGQQFVLASLGKRLLDIAVGGAGNLHGDIGRHHTAFDGDEETLLPMFEQITDRGDVIGGEVDFRGDFGIVVFDLMVGVLLTEPAARHPPPVRLRHRQHSRANSSWTARRGVYEQTFLDAPKGELPSEPEKSG